MHLILLTIRKTGLIQNIFLTKQQNFVSTSGISLLPLNLQLNTQVVSNQSQIDYVIYTFAGSRCNPQVVLDTQLVYHMYKFSNVNSWQTVSCFSSSIHQNTLMYVQTTTDIFYEKTIPKNI